MFKGSALTHLSFWGFANYFQPGPQRAQRESYLKGKVLCWETSFSLNSSYPHGNKHLTEFSFASSTKWQEGALPGVAAACRRWGIVVQHSDTNGTCPAVVFVSWYICWWLWDGGKEKGNTTPNCHHCNRWCYRSYW